MLWQEKRRNKMYILLKDAKRKKSPSSSVYQEMYIF